MVKTTASKETMQQSQPAVQEPQQLLKAMMQDGEASFMCQPSYHPAQQM